MPLLDIQNLSVLFDTDDGPVTAVENVSFSIEPGSIVGLVGESGCGKSVTALSILRLIPSPPGRILSGRILFKGTDLLALSPAQLRAVRGNTVSMVFQEPMTALSPLMPVGAQLVEAIRFHRDLARTDARRMAEEWMTRIGIPDARSRFSAYPYQLSGGMRQRVMIAMALMLEPALIVADEPTTALDVTIQAQILDLIRQARTANRSVLLITHDMGVVWEMCDAVAVMYAAEIVESGPASDVLTKPVHPYTAALLESIPASRPAGTPLPAIPGQVPSAAAFPSGCRFHDRCPFAFARCAAEHPGIVSAGDRSARCFLARERGLPDAS